MTKPVVRRCPDAHFRRIIYDLIAFIADYPEQVMLTGIVQGWCPKCVFEDNLSSDLMVPPGVQHYQTILMSMRSLKHQPT